PDFDVKALAILHIAAAKLLIDTIKLDYENVVLSDLDNRLMCMLADLHRDAYVEIRECAEFILHHVINTAPECVTVPARLSKILATHVFPECLRSRINDAQLRRATQKVPEVQEALVYTRQNELIRERGAQRFLQTIAPLGRAGADDEVVVTRRYSF
nr:hypothetical protein [Pseudomonadota bacterium]